MMDRLEADGVYDPLSDPDGWSYRKAFDDEVRNLAGKVAADRDEMLRALPAGWRLCLHDGLIMRTEPDADLMSDRIVFKISQRYHTLKPGDVCNHPDRTEYGWPTVKANRLVGSIPTSEGDCPECGKPGARWVDTGAITVISHATDADHDVCPDVQRRHSWSKLLESATWEGMYAEAFDDIVWRGADRDAPALGIVAGAPAAPEPEDATSLYDKLREMFKRFNEGGQYRPDPPPIVRQQTLDRHLAAAELPRPPWIAVRSPFAPGDWFWIKREGGHGPGYLAGSLGSIEGRSLFRTGQFVARPDERGGWDVAEIMVSS